MSHLGTRHAAQRVLAFLREIDWSASSEDWKLDRLIEIIDRETGAKQMLETLETIAGFAPGNGDVCEIIARRARTAIEKTDSPNQSVKGDAR